MHSTARFHRSFGRSFTTRLALAIAKAKAAVQEATPNLSRRTEARGVPRAGLWADGHPIVTQRFVNDPLTTAIGSLSRSVSPD